MKCKISGYGRSYHSILASENESLRKVVEFYANKGTYNVNVKDQWQPIRKIDIDLGENARKALEEINND